MTRITIDALARVLTVALILASASSAPADDREIGRDAFAKACSGCHNDTPVPRAMTPAQMAKLPPEKIYQAQTGGLMLLQAAALSDAEKRALAIYVSATPWGTVPDATTPETLVRCAQSPAMPADALERPFWSGWGVDLDSTHFQTAKNAGLTATDLAGLELKWAFGFRGATTVSTQPAVAGGRIFLGAPEGGVYALDARSGCAHWKFATPGAVRGAILIERRANGPFVLFAGDRKAWVYAIDADRGELLWKDQVDTHPSALITGSPVLHDGVLYVPVASFEELAGGAPTYPCCTFRGSIVAYRAATGERLWKSYTIPAEPAKTRQAANGTQLWAPNGAAVWSQPTIDPAAGVLYVTTGDSYSSPAAATSDAVVAMDLQTGVIRWHLQATADDAFSAACVAPNADPVARQGCGPDLDFGSSPILRRLPGGGRVLLAGQKSGVLHALDPDDGGRVLWQKRLSPGGVLGGIEWGFAADDTRVYVPISDVWETRGTPGHAGGIYALEIATGADFWTTPAVAPDCLDQPGCNAGQPAAATLIPGVLFSGSMDGHMRAYDPVTGGILWDVDTKRDYPTVNEIAAHGGAIKGAGVTVVDGWVYFGSGYGLWGLPGNVFLAFGPK